MKIKLDENLPAEPAADLRAAGHDTDTVPDENLSGQPDTVVLETARDAERVLFTLDKGIANIVRYPQNSHAGVVLFRRDLWAGRPCWNSYGLGFLSCSNMTSNSGLP